MLDVGCGRGYFSARLSLQSTTIGLDIVKQPLAKAQKTYGSSNQLFFVLADISSMPFRSHSIDVVVCASVLEHIQNLGGAIKQIKDVIKNDGMLIVGYPIETKFFKFMMRLIHPQCLRYIDQSQESFYNKCPYTHKQDYRTIRDTLRKNFLIKQKQKLPFKIFPDLLTFYECIKCILFSAR